MPFAKTIVLLNIRKKKFNRTIEHKFGLLEIAECFVNVSQTFMIAGANYS
jgi:hypothetical protein